MISTDTNILARAFLEDDPVQSSEAQEFLEKAAKSGELFISSYAILEFAWVLKVKKFTRESIYNAIITLCDSSGIIIGNNQRSSPAKTSLCLRHSIWRKTDSNWIN